MPKYWLLKSEPSDYCFQDLERDKKTVWDGVGNNLALKHLRNMAKGDIAFIYHTGKEKAMVGTATVVSEPYPDPRRDNARYTVVDIKVGRRLPRPVSLAEVKADPFFEDFLLVRLSRLSVMPVTAGQWKRLMKMAGAKS